MTYSLDEAVAWAKMPVSVRYSPSNDYYYVRRHGSTRVFTPISDRARLWYIAFRNRLAAYLPPEPKPGQNVDVVA